MTKQDPAKPGKAARLETAILETLGQPDWLESVTVDADGRAVLVVIADPGDLRTAESRRMEAESAARRVKGVAEARAVLTAERPGTGGQAQPAAGRLRARKGARLSDQALSEGRVAAPQGLAPAPGVSRILVVASAKGGVGKSTVAVNLAAALAKAGMKVGLLDADVYGPSIPTMLGTREREPVATADGKLIPIDAHGIATLSIGYLSDADAPMVWRGPIVTSAITQMLNDAAWGDPNDPLDILIIDTPPGTGDAQLAIAQRIPVTAALIVTTPQEVALADVRRGAAMFAKTAVPVVGIVETMSWFEDPSGARHHLLGQGGGRRTAAALGLPLLAELPILQEIRQGGDEGVPAATGESEAGALFFELARRVAIAIDQVQTKPPPEIVFED